MCWSSAPEWRLTLCFGAFLSTSVPAGEEARPPLSALPDDRPAGRSTAGPGSSEPSSPAGEAHKLPQRVCACPLTLHPELRPLPTHKAYYQLKTA